MNSSYKDILNMECFYASTFKNEVVFWKVLLTFIAPFFFIFLASIIWLIIYLLYCGRSHLRNNIILTVTVIIFIFHPNITDSLVSLLICEELESGEFWLQ